MSTKAKWIVAIVAILSVAALAALGALPYGYVLQGFLLSDNGALYDAAWVLYAVVAVLLALTLWRVLYLAVRHRPKQ
jgi:hypothetical protein